MFHPVGSHTPSVYWRRRLLAAGSAVILIVLVAVTVSALTSGSSGTSKGLSDTPVAAGRSSKDAESTHAASTHATSTHAASTHATSTHAASTHASSTGNPPSSSTSRAPSDRTSPTTAKTTAGSSRAHDGSSTGSASTTVEKCRSAELDIAAVVGQKTYHVGQDPKVELQVTNDGSAPCAQDLADKQVVLKVYNGVSRVWGSQDCQIQPGKKVLTLAVDTPVLVSVSWSGETSQPGCSGTRQHVGAGTYTLYASLSGKTGTAARFTIS